PGGSLLSLLPRRLLEDRPVVESQGGQGLAPDAAGIEGGDAVFKQEAEGGPVAAEDPGTAILPPGRGEPGNAAGGRLARRTAEVETGQAGGRQGPQAGERRQRQAPARQRRQPAPERAGRLGLEGLEEALGLAPAELLLYLARQLLGRL